MKVYPGNGGCPECVGNIFLLLHDLSLTPGFRQLPLSGLFLSRYSLGGEEKKGRNEFKEVSLNSLRRMENYEEGG